MSLIRVCPICHEEALEVPTPDSETMFDPYCWTCERMVNMIEKKEDKK